MTNSHHWNPPPSDTGRQNLLAATVAELGTSVDDGGSGLDVLGLQEVVFGGPGSSQTMLFTGSAGVSSQKSPLSAECATANHNPLISVGWDVALEAAVPEPLLAGDADPSFRIDGNAMLCHSRGGWSQWTVVPGTHSVVPLAPHRCAQRVILRHTIDSTSPPSAGGLDVIDVCVANTHLHWARDPLGVSQASDAEIRAEQMESAFS